MLNDLIKAKVTQTKWLTDKVWSVTLTPEHYHSYHAGQYLALWIDKSPVYFSIANAPNHQDYLLHIRIHQNATNASPLLSLLQENNTVTLLTPQGECHVNNLNLSQPIIYIAGGTGIAPIHAMIEAFSELVSAPAQSLIWGVNHESEAYLDTTFKHYIKQKNLNYHLYANTKSLLPYLKQCQEKDPNFFLNKSIVIQGPFKMVFSITKYLLKLGVQRHNLASDAYIFSQDGV